MQREVKLKLYPIKNKYSPNNLKFNWGINSKGENICNSYTRIF